jgi:hypothetical protein
VIGTRLEQPIHRDRAVHERQSIVAENLTGAIERVGLEKVFNEQRIQLDVLDARPRPPFHGPPVTRCGRRVRVHAERHLAFRRLRVL